MRRVVGHASFAALKSGSAAEAAAIAPPNQMATQKPQKAVHIRSTGHSPTRTRHSPHDSNETDHLVHRVAAVASLSAAN